MENRKHIIWDWYDGIDENLWFIDDMIEEYEINERDTSEITPEAFREWIYETNASYLDCERENLSGIIYPAGIVALASLGLWNGRKAAHRFIDSGRVSDCLYSDERATFYVDENGDFCLRESHHDGTNEITFRGIKAGVSVDDIENALESGGVIDALTEKIGGKIAAVYGWDLNK